MELRRQRTTERKFQTTPRFKAVYKALLDFCRARLALKTLLEIKGVDSCNTAANALGAARTATLSKLVKTLLDWNVGYSIISDMTTRLGAAKLTTANIKKIARVYAMNIEIHLTRNERIGADAWRVADVQYAKTLF